MENGCFLTLGFLLFPSSKVHIYFVFQLVAKHLNAGFVVLWNIAWWYSTYIALPTLNKIFFDLNEFFD